MDFTLVCVYANWPSFCAPFRHHSSHKRGGESGREGEGVGEGGGGGKRGGGGGGGREER
jgi:hypothetical protein